jgi:MSHA pilin protein MshD
MSIPRDCSGFRVQGSGFKDPGFGYRVEHGTRNSELGTQSSELGTRNSKLRERGLSLVELIVFIVIVGVAVAGVLGALNVSTRASADPMIQKQVLAIAEAILEEVQLQPFTFCDPDDPAASTALSVTDCATQETIGVEGGETRYGAPVGTPPFFDNVSDYSGFDSNTAVPAGIRTIDGALIAGLDAYRVTVGVAGQTLSGIGDDANGRPQSLLITVTVTGPGNTTATLHGYRVRYAPNALP